MDHGPSDLGKLSPEKLKLLNLLMQEKRVQAERHGQDLIPVHASRTVFPLSFAQQRLWFLDKLAPGSAAYNIAKAVRLSGPLHVTVLEQALNEIQRRHQILRTTFELVDNEIQQVVHDPVPLHPGVEDLSAMGAEEQQRRLHDFSERSAVEPFDLEHGPLFRCRLVRLGPEELVLLLAMHHIVSDGWSIGLLLKELGILYQAFSRGQSSPLAELKIQYGDFSLWQRSHVQGEVARKQLDYWRRKLEGSSSFLELPADRPRPLNRSFRGAMESLLVPADLAQRVRNLARQTGATLFMALLTGFQLLLHRYTGQFDFNIGTPVANRRRTETEDLIGVFINTLLMRADISGNPTVRELLARIQATAIEAYAHQDIPFEQLVQELNPERVLDEQPLFQVMFIVRNEPVEVVKPSSLRISFIPSANINAAFDLTLSIHEADDGLSCWMEYDVDRFERDTVRRLLAHYQNVLHAMVEDPDAHISELLFLCKDEVEAFTKSWNDTERENTERRMLHELFQHQACLRPQAVAVKAGNTTLTYEQLDRRSDDLAYHLQRLGAAPEVKIGICLERSPLALVAMLAVLKSGAAYLPLDPHQPAERLQRILRSAAPGIILVNGNTEGRFSGYNGCVVHLERDWPHMGAKEATCNGRVHPENLVYVLYTSGSTGEPKGVAVEHRQLLNQVLWCRENFQFTENDCVLQKASLAVDVSILETLLPLICGAKIVMAAPDREHDPHYLIELISEEKVTYLDAVPILLENLLEISGNRMSSVRLVTVGGEPLSQQLVNKFYEKVQAPLWNCYGPTETTVQCTTAPCSRGTDTVLIGRPIANTRVYVLDSHRNMVPVNAKGELHIGGDGVARGYLGRPDLTAERFIPDPFSTRTGARLYCSGDIVRWTTAGALEYCGRLDGQVKMRGHRVELGEVESVLLRHSGVQSAAAVLSEGERNQRLLAFVVMKEGAGFSQPQIRHFLQQQLPAYMVPSRIAQISELPTLLSGKLDRKALSRMTGAGEENDAATPPRTELERAIAALFCEVLRAPQADLHSNFFELGGHSLMAAQMVSRVRVRLNVELSIRDLFKYPTVAELAGFIESQQCILAQQQGRENCKNVSSMEIAGLLDRIEQLSEAEAESLLSSEAGTD